MYSTKLKQRIMIKYVEKFYYMSKTWGSVLTHLPEKVVKMLV